MEQVCSPLAAAAASATTAEAGATHTHTRTHRTARTPCLPGSGPALLLPPPPPPPPATTPAAERVVESAIPHQHQALHGAETLELLYVVGQCRGTECRLLTVYCLLSAAAGQSRVAAPPLPRPTSTRTHTFKIRSARALILIPLPSRCHRPVAGGGARSRRVANGGRRDRGAGGLFRHDRALKNEPASRALAGRL